MPDIAAAVREAGTVRKATRDESARLATVLARAFYDDPQFAWVVTDESRRMKILERGFDLFLRKLWFAQDECYTTDSIAGVAAREHPAPSPPGRLGQLRPLPHNAGNPPSVLP